MIKRKRSNKRNNKGNSLGRKKGSLRGNLTRPVTSFTSKIRQVGNSKGIILTKELVESAGFAEDADIIVEAHKGSIIILEVKEDSAVNTNLSSWDLQFKKAISSGSTPEGDLFEGMENQFDKQEW